MSNHILDLRLDNRSVDPVSAEVEITVRPERLTATTELRGRLTGPSCPYAATVEIAYPLLPPRRSEPVEEGTLRARIIIPEASLWDPQSPFLYSGPIELWQDGKRCDRVVMRHGLCRLSLTRQGLRVNGKLFPLVGRRVTALDEEQGLALRRQGCNLLLVEVSKSTLSVWDAADRLGFLVLGQARLPDSLWDEMVCLSRRPCCLGWLLPAEMLDRGKLPALLAVEASPAIPDTTSLIVQREGNRLVLRAAEVELGHVEDAQAPT